MSLWYTARGAGLAALILLSLSTCLGALVSRHTGTAKAAGRYLGQYLHRAFAGLGLLVLVIHIVTICLDPYAHVSLGGALVPFTAGFRPSWVGLGTLSVYTFLGVSLLGLARGRMATTPRGARTWRRLHALAYAGWAMAIVHGFLSGTDSSVGWVRVLYLGCLAAVVGSVAVRGFGALVARPNPEAPADRFANRPVPSRRALEVTR